VCGTLLPGACREERPVRCVTVQRNEGCRKRYLDTRSWDATTVFGRHARIDPDGLCTFLDEKERLQASYAVAPSKYPSPRLGLQEHTITLPDGDVMLFNGIKGATRRSSHNGHLAMRGRWYEFRHQRRGSTDVCCDGELVAAVGRSCRRRVHEQVPDPTDLLAAVLCEFAVVPGRPTALGALLLS
jgi:hypothetical protein